MDTDHLHSLFKEKTREVDEMNEKRKQLLWDKLSEQYNRKLKLEAKDEARADLYGNAQAEGDDVIKLNVGGVRMECRRATLTQFPTSKLAKMFSGRWDKKVLRDKKNRIFLDVDPVCFRIILEHLVVCFNSPADASLPLPEVNDEILKATLDHLILFFDIFSKDQLCRLKKIEVNDVTTCTDSNNDVDDYVECLDALTVMMKEERSLIHSIEQALVKDEDRFVEEERFIYSFATGDTSDIVLLEVGGEVVAVRRSTLRLWEGSVLHCQFDEEAWRQGNNRKREGEGVGEQGMASDSDDDDDDDDMDDDVVLIEQPVYAFGKLVDQLRLMAITPPGKQAPRVSIPPQQQSNYEAVVQYYFPGQEHVILFPVSADLLSSSSILDSRSQALLLQGWVQEAMPARAEVSTSLLYQASRDGFGADDFHGKCDGESATVTLVKTTEGFVFGGYCDQSWDERAGELCAPCGWKASPSAFVFSMVNPAHLAPSKQLQKTTGVHVEGKRAMQCDPNNGPLFGLGNDIHICDHSNIRMHSYSRMGNSYILPAGQSEMAFLTGSKHFLVAEIEVFAVQQ